MGSYKCSSLEVKKLFDKVLDLRSDTVTLPTDAMRDAMRNAEVGDNVFREDPTVIELEARAAEITGKEASLFVSSGTQANLIAQLSHCWGRGIDVIVGNRSHIFINEQGGASMFGGLHHRTIDNDADGGFNLNTLRRMIRDDSDPHFTQTGLVCLENTHNRCCGAVLKQEFIDHVCAICREFSIPVHMDGARLFNAAAANEMPAAEIVANCASVSFCLSKGLGAPVGSLLCGSTFFINRARRLLKPLGGAMRQCGVLAAAGLIAISWGIPRLHIDNQNARIFAKKICSLEHISVDPNSVHSNIIYFEFNHPNISAQELVDKLAFGKEFPYAVLFNAYSSTNIRIVFNHHISRDDVDLILHKIKHYIK